MYNVIHVKIYEHTSEVVYVGYTPGYMWSFPYYGVPIYGTGWYYPPYWGLYYYPRPPPWGLHVGYNPWTGWRFGVSWGGPFFRVGVIWGGGYGVYRSGWYGGGYRHNTVSINTGDINIGNSVSIGNRNTARNKLKNSPHRDNLYNRPENRQRNANNAALNRDFKQARHERQRPNNVFAGRDGQVARRQDDKWQTRTDNKWRDVPQERKQQTRDSVQNIQRQQTRPQHSQQASQFNRQNMNRQHQARQLGAARGRRR